MRKQTILLLAIPFLAALAAGARLAATLRLGPQPDGTFVVATEQRIEPGTVAFEGRPIDLALSPDGAYFAVLNQTGVFLADGRGVIDKSRCKTAAGPSFRGCIWSPGGDRLYASLSNGKVERFRLDGRKLV